MRTTALAAVIAATAFAAPALADFYIVREGASGPCRVVDDTANDVRTILTPRSSKGASALRQGRGAWLRGRALVNAALR